MFLNFSGIEILQKLRSEFCPNSVGKAAELMHNSSRTPTGILSEKQLNLADDALMHNSSRNHQEFLKNSSKTPTGILFEFR